ncbi:MAG: insulinase family protein, partial [Myxococcales bacterium]|nr:insulinase family protein [Myxococcales bacterium]
DDLATELQAFFAAHYRGPEMALAVVGRESLDDLEAFVRRELARVPGGRAERPERPPLLLPEQLGVEIRVRPLGDVRVLELVFPVPPVSRYPRERPLDFVASLLADPSQGSILAALRARGWATGLSASADGPDDASLLRVHIDLTAEGMAHRDDVVTLFFDGVEVLRRADLMALYAEHDRLGELRWRFAPELPPDDLAVTLATSLLTFEAEELLEGPYRFRGTDPTVLRDGYLAALTPAGLRLVVVDPGVVTDREEAVYGVPYAVQALSEARRAAFVDGESGAALSPPDPNPWMPRATTPLAGPPTSLERVPDASLEVWHELDPSVGPRAAAQVRLTVDLADPKDRARNRVLAALLADRLAGPAHRMAQAGVELRVSAVAGGLQVDAVGFDDRLPEVLGVALASLAAPAIDGTALELAKLEVLRGLGVSNDPLQAVYAAVDDLLLPGVDGRAAEAAAVRALTVDGMTAFAGRYASRAHARILVHGNVAREGVAPYAEAVKAVVASGPVALPTARQLPAGTLRVRMPQAGTESALAVVFQGAPDTPTRARLTLLAQLLRTDLHAELRSRQQVASRLYLGSIDRGGLPALLVGVGSTSRAPDDLLERLDAFLAERPALLGALDPAVFGAVRDGLADALEAPVTDLDARTARLQAEVEGSPAEAVAAALRALTPADMEAFARSVLVDAPHRLVAVSPGSAQAGGVRADCEYPGCGVVDSYPTPERAR